MEKIETEIEKLEKDKQELELSTEDLKNLRAKIIQKNEEKHLLLGEISNKEIEKNVLEELINNCLDFFKLVFIVSNFRGHNGEFHFKNENNDREEIEEVEAFLKTVYEIEKKVLKIIGGR